MRKRASRGNSKGSGPEVGMGLGSSRVRKKAVCLENKEAGGMGNKGEGLGGQSMRATLAFGFHP